MSALDEKLQMLRKAHEAHARYTLYRTHAYPNHKQRTIIAAGLRWKEAKTRMEELNRTRSDYRMGAPIYGVQLEET